MSAQLVDPAIAEYATRIAKFLNDLGSLRLGYGEIYVSGVTLSLDGEDAGVSLVPNDFERYSLRVDGAPA